MNNICNMFMIFVCLSVLGRVAVRGQRTCPPTASCPDQLPSTLTCLTLMNSQCPVLKDGVLRSEKLANLPNLERLSINNCGIKLLYKKVFEKNKELRFLELIGNRFLTLTMETFDGLRKLETLRILKSQIVSLPDNVFQALTSLSNLQLSANKITTITAACFQGLSNLRTLNLGFNNISTLTRDIFYTLPAVETIMLESNQLASIPRHLFAANAKLRNVDLKSNQLSAFEPGLGSEIEYLDLSYNQLTHVPKVRVTNCTIGYNKITRIDAGDLTGVDITVLDLTGNPITTVEVGAFSGTAASLSSVYLVSTNLTSLAELVLKRHNISLELDKNQNWRCECDQLWLAKYLQSRPGGPSCGPQNHPGRLLKDILKELDAECTTTSVHSSPTTSTARISSPTSKESTSHMTTPVIHLSMKTDTKGLPLANTSLSNPPTNSPNQGQLAENKSGSNPSTANIPPLIAGAVCFVLLIAGIATGIFIWKKKQQVKPFQYPSSTQVRNSNDFLPDFQNKTDPTSLPNGSTDGPRQIKFQSHKHL